MNLIKKSKRDMQSAVKYMQEHRGETKAAILAAVKAEPGLTSAGIEKQTKKYAGNSLLNYVNQGHLQRRMEDGAYHYYPADHQFAESTPENGRREPGEARQLVLDYVGANPGKSAIEITEATGTNLALAFKLRSAGLLQSKKLDVMRFYPLEQELPKSEGEAVRATKREEYAKQIEERKAHKPVTPAEVVEYAEANPESAIARELADVEVAPEPEVVAPTPEVVSEMAKTVEFAAMKYVWETGANPAELRKFTEWCKRNV